MLCYMDERLNFSSLKEKADGFKNASKRKMVAAKAGSLMFHSHNFGKGFVDIALMA